MKKTYEKKYDVLVLGGGVSGCCAAIAAARAGQATLMVEQNGYLGGALTGCGVGPMMTFHAGGEQVIRGIMQELVARMQAAGGSLGHIADSKEYCGTVTPFNTEIMKRVLDEMLAEAGCAVLFHTMLGKVNVTAGEITSITVCNKDGLNDLSATVYVDASGDGDLASFAGAPMTYGRESDGAAQPMTMNMKYCNVDTEALLAHIMENKDDFAMLRNGTNPFAPRIPLDLANFKAAFTDAKVRGEISFDRNAVLMFCTDRKGEFILNTTRVLDHDATDAASLSEAEQLGRKQCVQLDAFMRKYAPGFEHALLEMTGPSIGVRGSRQLVGCYTVTAQDLLEKRKFPDSIAHSGYPIDIHDPKGAGGESIFLTGDKPYYSLPYRSMVCDAVRNLIVTGRCVSASFEAQAGIRTTPTVGALGHAAGVAAALAAQNGGDAKAVDIATLQTDLIAGGAFLDL